MTRPKKHTIRGRAKALVMQKKEKEDATSNFVLNQGDFNGNIIDNLDVGPGPAACGGDNLSEVSDKQQEHNSRSAKKMLDNVQTMSLALDNNNNNTDCDSDNNRPDHGFVLIDSRVLCEYLDEHAVCSSCSGPIHTRPDFSNSKGFAVPFNGHCAHCHTESTLFTSSNKQSSNNAARNEDKWFHSSYEINLRMVMFIREIGKGHSALNTFSKIVNTTGITSTAYDGLFTKLYNACKNTAENSMQCAATEVREEIGRDIMVSVDGTWQRRGHASRNGVTTTGIVTTGKIVDVDILTNYCKLCELGKKDSEHDCKLNHTGSAGSMEGVGATNIFKRSEASRDLRYTEYLGDGDTSAYQKVVDSKPYGDDTVVNKLECIGHIQKRIGGRLRKLKTSYRGQKLIDGKTISGKGRLTDTIINRLQNYYGMAIRNNLNSVNDMQTNILATLYHVASNADNPDHDLCPHGADSWCKFQQDPESYVHKDGLPACIVSLIEPIYDDLSNPELLSKCMHGQTQNTNESFHRVIWDRCMKEVWVGRPVLEQATYSAVAHFNDGSVTIINILKELGLLPGFFTYKYSIHIDSKRLSDARRKSSEQGKQRRKVIRATKKGFMDKNKENEGETYSKGGF